LADHITEEEQIEAFKRWWAENGLQLAAAAVLLAGSFFSWQWWQDSQQQQAEQGSKIYMELVEIVTAGQPGEQLNADDQTAVNKLAEQLKAEYSSSGYGHFAALLKAKLAVDNGDLEQAAAELQWVLDGDPEPSTKTLTILRLARLEASRGNVELALQAVQGVDPGAMKSAYEEAKGDFYVMQGDTASAHTAYQTALLSDQSQDSRVTAILRLKLSQTTPAVAPPSVVEDAVSQDAVAEDETAIEEIPEEE
jgi:predicted negative regulator of RcsB-dependent stress response